MMNNDPQGRFFPISPMLIKYSYTSIQVLLFTKLGMLSMNVNTLIEMAFDHVPCDT